MPEGKFLKHKKTLDEGDLGRQKRREENMISKLWENILPFLLPLYFLNNI